MPAAFLFVGTWVALKFESLTPKNTGKSFYEADLAARLKVVPFPCAI
jgi:hypothetical protein